MLQSQPEKKGEPKVKQLLNRKSAAIATAASVLSTGVVKAQSIQEGINAAQTDENPDSIENIIQNIITILLFVVGAAAVIMLIIGGIRYVVSAGDQQAVANAKNTILYAIVGIVVAVLAYAAVQYVFDAVSA